jgi:hypothetical protein
MRGDPQMRVGKQIWNDDYFIIPYVAVVIGILIYIGIKMYGGGD